MMNHYIVLYREPYQGPLDEPFGFRCEADDGDHAEEQCANAYPEADILWVSDRRDLNDALLDYWCMSDFNEGV